MNYIKKIRKEKNITQEQLANVLGLQRSVISKYENGMIDPSVSQAKKIADILGVSLFELLNGKPYDSEKSFVKIPPMQVIQAISKPPESPEDQIVYFYSKLNTDGKLAAAICFFRHMKEEDREIVRDYIKKLSETPQFQQLEEDPDTPIDTSADEKPDEE